MFRGHYIFFQLVGASAEQTNYSVTKAIIN